MSYIVFPDATTGFLAGMGFGKGNNCALYVGGFKRFGLVEAYEWVCLGVRLTPVRAYRDFTRAEFYANNASDSHPHPTGRRFIQPMACRDGKPVFVVHFERWED